MKKFSLSAFSIFIFFSIYGQASKKAGALVSLAKLQVGGQGIGLSYEPKISKRLTIDLCAGVGGGYSIAKEYLEYDFFNPAVYFSVAPRFFYNIAKRAESGKNMEFNSGNYLGGSLKYNLPFKRKYLVITKSYLANLHWGIQRSLGRRFIFNSHVGVGYAWDIPSGFGTIYPSLDFRFSYVL